MSVAMMMIPAALLLGATFLVLFLWATKNGQYDDMDTPANRMLIDDIQLNKKNQINDTNINNLNQQRNVDGK